jgi:hypothetical protein
MLGNWQVDENFMSVRVVLLVVKNSRVISQEITARRLKSLWNGTAYKGRLGGRYCL